MRSRSDVQKDLRRLLKLDARLIPIRKAAGEILPRTRPHGFEGLARIICGQQLSVQSANAIWGRLEACGGAQSAQAFLALDEKGLQGVGLSRTKYVYIRTAAHAIVSGELNLDTVVTLPANEAVEALIRHKGIGRWTAEIYLMFCAGHPDIFPAGDLALRKAVTEALALQAPPSTADLADLASCWSPYRSTAALLFWRLYAATRHRESLPV